MSHKVTDKTVKAMAAPSRGNRITYDSEVKGFGGPHNSRLDHDPSSSTIAARRMDSSGAGRSARSPIGARVRLAKRLNGSNDSSTAAPILLEHTAASGRRLPLRTSVTASSRNICRASATRPARAMAGSSPPTSDRRSAA